MNLILVDTMAFLPVGASWILVGAMVLTLAGASLILVGELLRSSMRRLASARSASATSNS